MNANSELSDAKSFWLSEGLLIASAPVVAYLLTLSYIAGYAGFFQIPTEFISVSLTTMFSVAVRIGFTATIVGVLFLLFFLLWPHTDSPILHRALRMFPFVALLLIQGLFFWKRWLEWIGTVITCAMLAIHFFLSPLIGRTRGLSYEEKLREFDNRQA